MSIAQNICQELLQKGPPALTGNELIIGVEGEAAVNGRDFYSVFVTEPLLRAMPRDASTGIAGGQVRTLPTANVPLSGAR